MFGRLPRLHQTLVVLVALVLGTIAGLVFSRIDVEFAATLGAALGALAGLAIAYALVHDFHQPRRHRVRRR